MKTKEVIKIKINYKINIDKWENEFYNELSRSNIKIFTYEDYFKYQKFINEKSSKDIDKLKEDSAYYELGTAKNNEKKINNEDDKVCRKMLDIKIEGYQELEFGKYIVDDVNNYTEEELLKEKTYLSKFMLIEKYKKGGDLSECLDKVVKVITSNNNEYKGKGREVLMIMISKTLKEKVGKEKSKELIKKLRGDEDEMLQILETIREENEELREKGRQEGRLDIIKEMLKRNMPIDLISEITHASKQVIRKIANS